MEKIMIKQIINSFSRAKEVTVDWDKRILVIINGKIKHIFASGKHKVVVKPDESFQILRFSSSNPYFPPEYHYLIKNAKDRSIQENFVHFETNENQVAIIKRDNMIHKILKPLSSVIYWRDDINWECEYVDISENLEIEKHLAKQLQYFEDSTVLAVSTHFGQSTLIFIDGGYYKSLVESTHYFWNINNNITTRHVDIRTQKYEVTGQELLTKDRVTIRVNITAEYRVIDPIKAITEAKDFMEMLHLSLQYAFRHSVAGKNIDEILTSSPSITQEEYEKIKRDMSRIGIQVENIALKDIILPGEMRDIFNEVIAAQKQAETNTIRRREETAATRSLLNTAKVMEENPIMLRLKELETLEKILQNVDNLNIHNGTEGLLKDLIKLR